VIGGTIGISYAAPSSDILTLKEAIDLGLKNSDSASKLDSEEKQLSFREDKLEASRVKHKISSQVTNSNSLSNTDNPSAETTTQQLSMAYQLNFENGLQGTISNTQASTGLSSGSGGTTSTDSTTLTLTYPLYGLSAENTQLTNEQSLLSIQSDTETLESNKASLQTQIATAFFAHVTQIGQLRLAEEQLANAQEKRVRNAKISSQLTELNLLQLELAVQQAQQELLARQVTAHLQNLIDKPLKVVVLLFLHWDYRYCSNCWNLSPEC